VYLGKDRKCAILEMMDIHTTMTERTENVEHKLLADNFLLPDLFDLLLTKNINSCNTVRLNQKGCLGILKKKKMKIN
jgi:hypothetical protein